MNYRKLSMIALLVGVCVMSLPAPVSAGGTVQNFFSGPVLVTPGTTFMVCATNVAGGVPGPNGTVKILIGLLTADTSRILRVREAALNTPGQGSAGACLTVSAADLLADGDVQLQSRNVVAFAGNGLSEVQGFLNEAAGVGPGGGCITASLQIGDVNGSTRYIPMAQH